MVDIKSKLSFLAHQGGTTSASFCDNAEILATGGYDGRIRIWDTHTWQEVNSLPGQRRGHVTFVSGGAYLISAGLHQDAAVYSVKAWQHTRRIKDLNGVWGMCAVPGKRQIAVIQPDDLADDGAWKPIQVWDIDEWKLVEQIGLGIEDVYAIDYWPDGKHVAVSCEKGLVSIWDEKFTSKMVDIVAHDKTTWGVSLSPNGKILATGGADNLTRLWDTTTWKMLHQLPQLDVSPVPNGINGILCVKFSQDGHMLVTGGLDGLVTVWNITEE